MVVPPALALGAWSSRVVAGSPGRAVAVLTSGAVLTLVLGLRGSPVPWLAPPIMRTARELASGAQAGPLIGLTAWALVWGGRGAVRVRLAAPYPGVIWRALTASRTLVPKFSMTMPTAKARDAIGTVTRRPLVIAA